MEIRTNHQWHGEQKDHRKPSFLFRKFQTSSYFIHNTLNKSQHGFTVLEMLIALTISGIIIMLTLIAGNKISSMMLTSFHKQSQWDVVNNMRTQVISDLYRTEKIEYTCENQLNFILSNGKTVRYNFQNGKLLTIQQVEKQFITLLLVKLIKLKPTSGLTITFRQEYSHPTNRILYFGWGDCYMLHLMWVHIYLLGILIIRVDTYFLLYLQHQPMCITHIITIITEGNNE